MLYTAAAAILALRMPVHWIYHRFARFRATIRRMMCCRRFTASLCVVMAGLAFSPALADAENSELDLSLHRYAVQVLKTRVFQRGTLNGIYLGNGAVLTAAHVVGRWHLLKELHIGIAGQELPATIVKEGSLEETDLTVLSINEEQLPMSLRLRRNPVCKGPVRVGQEVVVVAKSGTARARVVSPLAIPVSARAKFGTVITDVPIAMSGTGVFDAEKRCLLGIISRRIARIDAHAGNSDEHAKYFVPAPTIAKFLPAEVRF